MDYQKLWDKVRQMEIITNRMVDSAILGRYRSAFKGRGLEFDKVRNYQIGDDIRDIDWNVTARAGTPYIKNFCEERELTILLLVDVSASLQFGSNFPDKHELAIEVAAVLALAAIKNNDKVGMITFSDRIEKFSLPRKGRGVVPQIIQQLFFSSSEGRGTDLKLAFDFVTKVHNKKAVVFIISDFIATGYQLALRQLANRYDLILISIQDPHEREIPTAGILVLEDAEQGQKIIVDSKSRRLTEQFRHNAKKCYQEQKAFWQKLKMDELSLVTGEAYLPALYRLFRQRSLRSRS